MHATHQALNSGHTNTALCRKGTELHRKRQQELQLRNVREIYFTIHDQPLQRTDTFKYLGRVLATNNSDWPTVYNNVQKAKLKWALVARPLYKTGVSPKFVGMFYKAIVQAVPLCGCETWVISPNMLAVLAAFHNRVVRKIANALPTRTPDGSWVYSPLQAAYETAGVLPIEACIYKRQTTLAQCIATRPVSWFRLRFRYLRTAALPSSSRHRPPLS